MRNGARWPDSAHHPHPTGNKKGLLSTQRDGMEIWYFPSTPPSHSNNPRARARAKISFTLTSLLPPTPLFVDRPHCDWLQHQAAVHWFRTASARQEFNPGTWLTAGGGWGRTKKTTQKKTNKKKTLCDENVKAEVFSSFYFSTQAAAPLVRSDQRLFVHPTQVEYLFFLCELFSIHSASSFYQ